MIENTIQTNPKTKELKSQIRQTLMNSKLRDSQTRETIPQLVFNEGMDLIVEEIANFIQTREQNNAV